MNYTDTPTVLNVRELAALLRISRAAAYQMCNDGRLSAVRIGKSIRVPRASVEKFLEGPNPDTPYKRES